MAVHQLWRFPRGAEDLDAMCVMQNQLTSGEFLNLQEIIWSYHSHCVCANQCTSIVVQRIHAPVSVVWSSVRRFDNPQAYKHFIRSCSMRGDGQVGSTRELQLVSGIPAESSTERLEYLDEERHILSFKILGGQHRLKDYRSTTTLNEILLNDGTPTTIVMESYVVDVPPGNSREETRVFADTIVKFNLHTLARISELRARLHAEPSHRDIGTENVG